MKNDLIIWYGDCYCGCLKLILILKIDRMVLWGRRGGVVLLMYLRSLTKKLVLTEFMLHLCMDIIGSSFLKQPRKYTWCITRYFTLYVTWFVNWYITCFYCLVHHWVPHLVHRLINCLAHQTVHDLVDYMVHQFVHCLVSHLIHHLECHIFCRWLPILGHHLV